MTILKDLFYKNVKIASYRLTLHVERWQIIITVELQENN